MRNYTNTNAANKVALNTIILYAKMLVTMVISLYSTRLVLSALGATDFGLFNLIAGVIAMLSFLNTAMTVSTQRYLSYHQGKGNLQTQKKIFTNSWVLHLTIGIIVILILLLLTPFLFNGFLNIPINKIGIAKVIYCCMTISVFFSIITVPFTASLNAHENMLWIAIVNIIEAIAKLGIAISLTWIIQSDRLEYYALLMMSLSIVAFLLYSLYCLKKYDECSVTKYRIDKPLIKELSSFAGWNLFGALCSLGKNQGVAIILNLFLGTAVNAAYAIATQVANQMNFFSATLLKTLNPQIMKSEGMNDRSRMLRLSMIASKFGFFLLAVIAIPCIFEMPAVLNFWLKEVPEYTVIFCILFLIATLANQLTIGLQSAIQATGKIKVYQAIVGSLLLLNLPVSYILLRNEFPVYSVLMSFICIELFACIIRMFFLKKLAGLSIMEYCKRVLGKEIIPVVMSIAICWITTQYFDFKFRFLLTCTISAITFSTFIYLVGLCKDEKQVIKNLISKVKSKYL